MTAKIANIGDIAIGGPHLIGPCQLESLDHARMMAGCSAEACALTGTRIVFKARYDKANLSSIATKRGPEILYQIREKLG